MAVDKQRGLNPIKTLEGLRAGGYLLSVVEKRRRLEEKEKLRSVLPPMARLRSATILGMRWEMGTDM